MTDVTSIISQLEQQKAAIDTAISTLRGITSSPIGSEPQRRRGRPPRDTGKAEQTQESNGAVRRSPLKGRPLSKEQNQAISNAWTPERKQRFAEFHVQRMARERGEDPAKALREYRRRKQMEQADGAAGLTSAKGATKGSRCGREENGRK